MSLADDVLAGKRLTCEFGYILSTSYGRGPRCRKRATAIVALLVPFGKRVRMDGPDEQTYTEQHEARCPLHAPADCDKRFRQYGVFGLSDYATWVAEARAKRAAGNLSEEER